MFYYKSRLIVGVIGTIFKLFFRVIFWIVYKFLAIFNLQFVFFTMLIGGICYFLGAFGNIWVIVFFYAMMVFSVLWAISRTCVKLVKKFNKKS